MCEQKWKLEALKQCGLKMKCITAPATAHYPYDWWGLKTFQVFFFNPSIKFFLADYKEKT